MIDFTNSKEVFNKYNGSEKKKTLIYNNNKYLVKFPNPIIKGKGSFSYINNAFSEYIGSTIFKMVGIDTQNTILGYYKYNGHNKIVCAYEDFTDENNILYEFGSLALSSNPDKRVGTEINDIMEVVENSSSLINVNDTKNKFWDMFIIDALIGNTDRHNGNWGFIQNKKNNTFTFSKIYDCGSCLNPMLDDGSMDTISEIEIKNLAINAYSCLKVNDKRINYMSFIKSKKYEDCNEALIRVFKNIDICKIESFIDSIDVITDARRKFYKSILKIRYDILSSVYNSLCSNVQ